ncbi:hypothetical protein FSP39_005668 [Pinctada imbricata]|uniref:Carboxylic ester hydrolase n=1 Tax=Pinctada imbricata TaxID=66713 RepID=A0AA88YPY1_PINIB|nr:hypothetical protein FSP39_005668 [Pinctada imbricata]
MDMFKRIIFIILLGLTFVPDICIAVHPVAKTSLGDIKGLQLTDQETGDDVYEFRGIRYAKPPTGARRFRKPEPVDPWTGEYDATHFGYVCPQAVVEIFNDGSKNQSEDCLFLNVYVPRSITSEKRLSVMVWIHGGGLIMGNGHFYDGTRLAVDGDVVVVTINYRLGILGFLALYHPASRGNYGLWDQKMALTWVHKHIHTFRGDPNSVTIFGMSSGGVSVSAQSLIPSNKGLFQRVIAQSGVISRNILVRKNVALKALTLLPPKTNCQSDDLYDFVDCLRQVDVKTLLDASNYWNLMPHDKVSIEVTYSAAVDGELFPEHPIKMLENPNSDQSIFFRSLDFIAGTTSQEGILYVSILPSVQEHFDFNVSVGIPSTFVCKGLLDPFVDLFYDGNQQMKDDACKFYTSNGSLDEQSNRACDLFADMIFTSQTYEMLTFHSNNNVRKTYQYQFSKIGARRIVLPPKWFRGSEHGADLIYLFRTNQDFRSEMVDMSLTGPGTEMSKWLISLWTSFAKSGVPDAGQENIPWLEYEPVKQIYLDLGEELSLKQKLKSKAVKFWTDDISSPDLVYAFKHNDIHEEL